MPTRVEGQVDLEIFISSGRVKADGDLSIGIEAFSYEINGKKSRFDGVASIPVTDDDTNYVYISTVGDLEVTTSGWPDANHLRLARVVALNGLITNIVDERVFLAAEVDREINQGAEENQSTSTSGVWEQKLRLTTEVLPAGKYLVQWYMETKHSDSELGNYVEARVQVNDTLEIGYCAWPFPAWDDFGGFRTFDVTGGAQNIDLDFKVNGSGTAYARRARLFLWRID